MVGREESIVEGCWTGGLVVGFCSVTNTWFWTSVHCSVYYLITLAHFGQEHLTSHSISLLLPKTPLPDVWMQDPSSDTGCLQSQRNIASL